MKQSIARTGIFVGGLLAGAATLSVVSTYGGSIFNAYAEETPKTLQMTLTGKMPHLDPRATGHTILYRFEDAEYKVVCYAHYDDFSGGFSCIKK